MSMLLCISYRVFRYWMAEEERQIEEIHHVALKRLGASRAFDSGGRAGSHGRFATPAQISLTRCYPAPRAIRKTWNLGRCTSFKGHFLSLRVKSQSSDSQLFRRAPPPAAAVRLPHAADAFVLVFAAQRPWTGRRGSCRTWKGGSGWVELWTWTTPSPP
jgi:hypothetical protein